MVTGKNLIAGEPVDGTEGSFTAGGAVARFEEASAAHVDHALDAAVRAFDTYRHLGAEARAPFLERIATNIDGNTN